MKRMVSWRLEEELIDSLKEEADRFGISVTELVERKLQGPSRIEEVLKILRRIERKVSEARAERRK